jgi:DNA-binding PadR family transcriptional regulator
MSLRHTLLGILDWTPAHGYALREMARGYSWIYPMSNANIYPTLRALEDEGLVAHAEEVRDGRLRKIYQITPDGRGELQRWLADGTTQRGTFRDPTLLKLCLLRDGAHAGARAWIERELSSCTQLVEQAERFLKEGGAVLPKYTRMVAEHGLDLARVRARWLAMALDEVQSDAGSDREDDR